MKTYIKNIIDKTHIQHQRHFFVTRDAWMVNTLNLPHLTKNEIKEANNTWPFVKVDEKDLIWLRVYKKEYGFNPYFVTDYQLLHILRKTNPYKQVVSLQNKAMLDVYYPDIEFPHNYLKCINGTLWNGEGKLLGCDGALGVNYLIDNGVNAFIIKPTVETGCGKGVRFVDLEQIDGRKEFLTTLLVSYGMNYVVQEVLQQHPAVQALNPTSVNCCRVTTLFFNGEFDYSTIIKFGKRESHVDNWNKGFLGGVSDDGVVNETAFDSKLSKITETDTGVVFGGLKLPCFVDMITCLKQWHIHYFPQIGVIGWDVVVDNVNRVKVIEINLDSPGVVGEQFCSGTFFKKHRSTINNMFR